MTLLRSPQYLAGSRGAPCALRIAGVCRDERETVVPCHVRDRHTGRSIKASDLSVANGCHRCHEVFDSRASMPNGELITEAEWTFYALRGLQETLEQRREIGLLSVPEPKPRVQTIAPRKPPDQRSKVGKSRPLPTGRKLQSRNSFAQPARKSP